MNLLIEASEIQDCDVLFGRDNACNGHVGTIAFKALVAARLDLYAAAPKLRRGKTLVTLDVYHTVGSQRTRLSLPCPHGLK
jgi:hypothetical protein